MSAIALFFVNTVIGRALAVAGAALIGLWMYGSYRESKGAWTATAKIERKNNAAASTARAAARGVTDPRVRGVEDPNAVDE